ncbi:hypothetical protein [Novosphingobium sp. AAP83]|uniref:hypothetical protein n=1 Tax=Novosphingobium sp. AAP83 TaxID=1523425 RepID=UPI0012F876F7|nr:hypothetical protein [Novosphingobium sp. AAP83]
MTLKPSLRAQPSEWDRIGTLIFGIRYQNDVCKKIITLYAFNSEIKSCQGSGILCAISIFHGMTNPGLNYWTFNPQNLNGYRQLVGYSMSGLRRSHSLEKTRLRKGNCRTEGLELRSAFPQESADIRAAFSKC